MPVKTRQIPALLPATWYRGTDLSNGNTAEASYPSVPYEGEYETITYENVGKSRFGNCFHLRRTCKAFPTYGVHKDQDRPLVIQHEGTYGPYITGLNAETMSNYADPTGKPEVSAFIRRATHALVPSIQSGFSAPDFIREFHELKSLVAPWRYLKEFWKELLPRVRDYRKLYSGTLLNWYFGWLPVLGDALELYKTLVSLRKRIEALRALTHRMVSLHYAESASAWVPLPAYKRELAGAHLYQEIVYEWIHPPKAIATIRGTVSIPYLDSLLGSVTATLDSLGFHWNPALFWNAVKYSFVIDWFFRVGDYLEQFSAPLTNVQVIVHDMCISHKFEYNWKKQFLLGPDEEPSITWIGTFKQYSRQRCLPDTGLLPLEQGDGLSPIRMALGAALLTANRH